MPHRRIARPALVVLIVVSFTVSIAAQGLPPTAVRVDAVRLEKVQDQRLVTGELRAVRRAKVATEESGVVLEVPIEEGHAVKKGDVLARLDNKRLEIELRQIEADEEVAKSGLEERRADAQWRELDLENYRGLAKGGASNPKELYDAESQARIAKAKQSAAERLVQSIHAKADLLRKRIADTTITAPFDGIVVSKMTEQGQWLNAGDAAVEVISTGAIDAWLDVPQQFAGPIMGKTPTVNVMIEATHAVLETSQLRTVPQVDLKARSFAVIARLANADNALAPGMSVTAWIPTGDMAERLTVHKDALLRSDFGAFVYVARNTAPNAPAIATPADVQVLFALSDRFVVKSSTLAASDLVIVEGNERLFPSAPVLPMPAEEHAEARK